MSARRNGRGGARSRRRSPASSADWLDDYESEFADDAAPINGYRMFRELWNVLDPDTTILTHESGASRDIQCVFYERRCRGPTSAGATRRSSASRSGCRLGAKLANPSKTVVNVMGDGAIGMTGMDLETASRENIPILTVIKHDSMFSGYPPNFPGGRALPRHPAGRRLRGPGPGARLAVGARGAAEGAAGGVPTRPGRHARRPAGPGRRDHEGDDPPVDVRVALVRGRSASAISSARLATGGRSR